MPIAFQLFEYATFLFAGLCWYAAWKSGRRWLLTVLAATLFGLGAELYFLISEHESQQGAHYTYGVFLLMVGWSDFKVPLWVGLGWGCIVFACVWTANLLSERIFVRPVIAGLLAMNIDLSLDPIAEQFGFWKWQNVPALNYFGVPFDNFLGWVLIVGSYSFSLTLLERKIPKTWRGQDYWVPLLALVPALLLTVLGQLVLNLIYGWVGNQAIPFVVICAVTTAIAIYFGVAARRDQKPQWIVLALPIYFHALPLGLLLFSGAYRTLAAMLVVIPVCLFVGFTVFAWPYLDRLFPEIGKAQSSNDMA